MKVLIIIATCIGCCAGVIYHLNDTEFDRMPNLIRLDPYEECFREPGAVYCTVRFALVSDTPSPLLNMIKEYTDHTPTHFNHTRILHGLCMKKRCKEFITNTSADIKDQLEACLNKTMWEEYQLKTKVIGELSCSNEERVVDTIDLTVAVFILVLLMLNVVGTLYDVILTTGKNNDAGIKFLVCFSIRRNFRKLISDPLNGSEPRLHQLKGLNGFRTIFITFVILAHSLGPTLFVDNSHYLEKLCLNPFIQILLNGTLIMQIFFIMAGFLLVYNLCLYVEKHECNWKLLLKGSLIRWLRLTPAYAVVLAFTATWIRHLGSGPLWNIMINSESLSCREYWWWHLIYLNNYHDKSTCMIQAWYLGADMQLFCVGITIFVLCRSKTSRIIALSVLFIIGVIIPTLHTYYQDLDGALMMTPETARGFFITDKTFNHVYKRGHTNLLGCVTGMTLGYLLYYWKDTGIDLGKYKKYRLLYWCTFPLLIVTIYSGSIFYADRSRCPLLFRTFYSALVKLVFCLLLAVGILGVVLKFENVYRSILEWNGWTVPSRLSYCAYLLHMAILRYIIGIQTSAGKITIMNQVNSYLGILTISFTASYPLWLLVEAPFAQLVKTIFAKTEESSDEEEKREPKLEIIEDKL